MANTDYTNPYAVEDYRDVLNLAWIWRSYWQQSKRQMINGYHWYYKEIPIITPKQVEPHVPSTATTLVNDAADHLAGNEPFFAVKALRESQRADEDRQRVQTCLNATWDLIGKQFGHPLHRSLSIHGGWSGMMAARVYVREGWDAKNPTIEDIIWQPEDPRNIYPDPGTGGRKAVIVWMQKNVGLIRQQWPDWDGHWFPNAGWEGQFYASPYIDTAMTNPSGGFIGDRKRLPQPLNDNATVNWIEYWDDKYKCYIANGVPVFRQEYGTDLIEHGLGSCPFVIRAAGYGDVTGEAQHRYRSMLANVFSELDTEAQLITQLKWIVQETAWPVYLIPKDAEGEFDTTPASLNFIENPESIKAVRTLREDAVEPKAIIELLQYIKDEIERATYPVILKGQAPSGIRAGYPIAILSTQARLKFASPTDALRNIFEELALKTLAVVKNRFKISCEVMDGYSLKPDDYDKYLGRITANLEPKLPQDMASKLPIMEFLYGSVKFPAMEVIRELGYENPEELRDLRMAEDLEADPRVIQVMVEHLIADLSPEAAAAVQQVVEPQLQMQQISQQMQEMQAKIQEMQLQQQMQAMQQPQQMAPPGGMAPPPQGMPTPPPQAPPQAPPGPPQGGPPIVPGGPGGTNFGQALGAPGQTNMARQIINPNTQIAQMARQQMALREMTAMGAQGGLYGEDLSGGGQP
jgi:hypothetical protein